MCDIGTAAADSLKTLDATPPIEAPAPNGSVAIDRAARLAAIPAAESPRQQRSPVAVVVISSNGEGDRSVESLDSLVVQPVHAKQRRRGLRNEPNFSDVQKPRPIGWDLSEGSAALAKSLGFEPVGDCGAVDHRLLRWFESYPRVPQLVRSFWRGSMASRVTRLRLNGECPKLRS